MIDRSALGWLALFASLLIAPLAASAQDRPSLGRIEAANCAKADIDGDSYRPFYCDARCDCSVGPGPPDATCTETAPGDFDIEWSVFGQCIQTQQACVDTGVVGFFCLGDPPLIEGSCTSSADCSPGFGCAPIFLICVDLNSGTPCTTSADCSTTNVCEDLGFPPACTSDSDCSGGETCQLNALCGRACSTSNDCPSAGSPAQRSITGVGAPESTTPARCLGGLVNLTVNHKDARACLAQAGCDLCGDGVVDSGEGCDDGNTTPGDGCDASCQVEP